MKQRGMKIIWLTLSVAGLAVCLWAAGMVALVKLVASPVERAQVVLAPEFDDVSAFGDEDKSRVDAWLQKLVDSSQYPSLSVAIVRDDKIVYRGAFGFEDIEAGRKASSETSYHVASVTKVITTSLAVMLHERGVVDLDKPVAHYLPKDVRISTKPELGATITLRQLASHTSGLPQRVPGKVQSVDGRYELEPKRLYDHLAYVTLSYDPGTDELYSNLGMGLLGHALELAADKPLDQLVKEMICEPLSLERTAIRVDNRLRMATGYSRTTPRRPEDYSRQRRLAASGGLVASAEDLAMFLAAQMKPGVFTDAMLKQLHTETTLSDGSKATTALGWSVRSRESVGRILKKNGGRNNCSDWIGFAPEHGVGVAVVTNCGDPAVDDIGYWLLERSIPGGHRPVTKYGYAKVAPYTGVRWEDDRPIVRVRDVWSPLVSIDGIPIQRITEFANEEYGEKAHKRFAEDLVEVLSTMGHQPHWEVTLGLETKDGQVEQVKIRMTEQDRNLAGEFLREAD